MAIKPNRKPRIFRRKGDIAGRLIKLSSGAQLKWIEENVIKNAFDVNDVNGDMMRDAITSIMSKDTAEADRICGRIYRDKVLLDGFIPKRSSRHTVPRGENRNLSPKAPAVPIQSEVQMVAYHALAQVGRSEISDEEEATAGALFNKDELAEQLEVCRRDANAAVDRNLAARLSSTTSNAEYDVTVDGAADWADGGSLSTMSKDIRNVKREIIPGADTIVIGPRAKQTMLQHAALLAGINNYATTAGASGAAAGALESWLKTDEEFENVFFLDKLVDNGTDRDGSTAPTKAHLFNDGVWIGYHDALIQVHPNAPAQDTAEIGRVLGNRLYDILYARYTDVVDDSNLADLGCYMTEINSTL